jgi:hypothetical protein
MSNTPPRILRLSVLLGACLWMTSCDAMLSKARGEVSNLKITADVGLINDQPDAGYRVAFNLTNRGGDGMISIRPWLSCSEGNYTRTQDMQFSAGEVRALSYFFHEPTINATNVQGGVKVVPAYSAK